MLVDTRRGENGNSRLPFGGRGEKFRYSAVIPKRAPYLSRFVTTEELYDRPPSGVILVIKISQLLTGLGLHHKAVSEILHIPRCPKTPLLGKGIIIHARWERSADSAPEQLGDHFTSTKQR
jgi:hypothetical protein